MSQFSQDVPGQKTLKDLLKVSKDVYPIGRLDKDSEGLLLLSNDPNINHKLLHPSHQHRKNYWAQVDHLITDQALEQIKKGVRIKVNKKPYTTLPAEIKRIEEPEIWERNPPIRVRKNIPTSWVELSITEGKNRQVRKMLSAVGFPVLRLIRVKIENIKISTEPGLYFSYPQKEFYELLKLN